MNESKFWGPHPMENVYALDWCNKAFLEQAVTHINKSLSLPASKQNFAEIRVSAFWLAKFSDWFKDVVDFRKQLEIAIKKLHSFLDSEEIENKYEMTMAIKNQMDQLEKLLKEANEL